ncbi:MAG: alpha-amylase family glycosyl hydrolase [Pseudomonadota bacterium]
MSLTIAIARRHHRPEIARGVVWAQDLMRIVFFGSPHCNAAGRVDFDWHGPGDALLVELRLAGVADGRSVRVEAWTNVDHNDAPWAYSARSMTWQGDRDGIAHYSVQLAVHRVGTYRVAARVTDDGGASYLWTTEQGFSDLVFRPRDPALDRLDIEVLSVPNLNACDDGLPGTLADLMGSGSPLEDGAFTLRWLAEQGKNTLWLLPVFPGSAAAKVHPDDVMGSPYAPVDFFSVRPELAARARGLVGEAAQQAAREEFLAFVDAAHALGLRVILDLALNHVGHGFRFRDLFCSTDTRGRERRVLRDNDFSQLELDDTQRADLQQRLDDARVPPHLEHLAPWMFGAVDGFPAGARQVDRIAPGGWFEWPDARQLNHGRRRLDFHRFEDADPTHAQRQVRAWLIRVLRYWAVDMRVDGFRLDHLAGLPPDFVEQACNLVQADVDRNRPGTRILFIGEDYDTAGVTQHLVDLLQADWLATWIHDSSPQVLEQIVDSPWFCHLLGLSNHDMDRPLRRLGTNLERTRALVSLLHLVGGPVMDVAGDDLGEDERMQVRRLERVPALRHITRQGRQHAQVMRQLRQLRREQPVLHGVRRAWLRTSDGTAHPQLLAMVRHSEGGEGDPLLVVANLDPRAPHRARFALDVETMHTLVSVSQFSVQSLFDSVEVVTSREPGNTPPVVTGSILALHLQPLQVQVWALKSAASRCGDANHPSSPRTTVAFTCRATTGARVELCGDFPQWDQPWPMQETESGTYRCQLDLAPGVYRYRFRVDGRTWLDDEHAATVDRSEGVANAVLVVSGSASPLFFAPDPRHLQRQEGRVVVQLVHEGATPPRHLWLHPGHSEVSTGRAQTVPLRCVHRVGERALLRAELTLDGSDRPWQLSVDRHQGPRFSLPRPDDHLAHAPTWARAAVFYGIFVDRWHTGAGSTPDARFSARSAPSTASTYYGGDLDGVTEHLNALVQLGVDALVLTPLQPSPTPHRYDATDLLCIDPLLGGEAALQRLLEAAHTRELRVVVDLSVTHVNQAHPAFQDLLQQQQRSAYRDWFHVQKFPVLAGDARTVRLYPTRPELPVLNLESGPAREHALAAALHLVELGVDGLRLDNMGDASASFWAELRSRARALNPELLLLGEVVSDRPHRFAQERGADLVTDFGHREAMLAFFGRAELDAATFWQQSVRARFGMGPFDPSFFLLFVDNHDTGRFVSRVGFHDRLRLALAYLLFRPEPLWLTYGTELGMCCDTPSPTLDDAWPDRQPMPEQDSPPTRTAQLIREFSAMRHSLEPWQQGELVLRRALGSLLVLERRSDRGTVRGYFNVGDDGLVVDDLPASAVCVVAVNTDSTHGSGVLAPRAAAIYWTGGEIPSQIAHRTRSTSVDDPARSSPRNEGTESTLSPVDAAFRAGRVDEVPLPARFYLNLTERCGLRCGHCLTRAPERTRDGTARDMSAAVVEALAPHLVHAHYVGFPHAGEPLLAPQLEPMLRALHQARGGEPTVVHLLTNGQKLDLERFAKLCELGVNSWSFSVDGLSARSHDVLRQGSHIERLLPLLCELADWRRQHRSETRLGIAWTVAASNLDEVEALVRFSAEIGLDWLKLEEMFAHNALSAREAAIPPEQLAAALHRAQVLAAELGLSLLDHTRTPELYNCLVDGDPVLAAFSRGDDRINRMAINPCRLPWELCCVEPDGSLKPVSFDHPVAGNILDQDLQKIWNGVVCADARRLAIRRRICHSLPLCARDPGPSGW